MAGGRPSLACHRYRNTMDTPVTTKLICLPLLPNAQAISIEVNSNTTVDRLKQKIKTECTPLLDGVGAPELLLYAPKNQDADQKTISQILANPNRYLQNLLNVFQTVAECFPTIPAGKIHILVRLPSTSSFFGVDPCASSMSVPSSFLLLLTTIPFTLSLFMTRH